MEKPNQQIIQKFIENKCSESEYQLMMEYLNSLDNTELNLFLDSHLQQIEDKDDKILPANKANFDSILKVIKPVKERYAYFGKRYGYSIAASVAFITIIGTLALYILGVFQPHSKEIIWAENVTQMGQKLIMSLPDGSDITLNGNGKLKYPQKFEAHVRDVYLEGEAFFSIVHDSSKPFIVHSGNLTITVLGTKFNVNAFKNSGEISISLVEGRVKVTNNEENGIKGNVLLTPQQKLVYNIEDDFIKIKGFDFQEEAGWKDNILVFNDEPLVKVFTRLERAFGIKFELKNKYYDKIKITTKFENSTIHTVNEVIKKLTRLEYKNVTEQNVITKVIFYKKEMIERRN